jgi:hypothetical protein
MAKEANNSKKEAIDVFSSSEKNKAGSTETGAVSSKESTSPSKNEENDLASESLSESKEENDFYSKLSEEKKKKQQNRDAKAHKVTKITQGSIVGGAIVLIVVGLIMIGANYVKKGPDISEGNIALSGDNTASFRFSITNNSKMDLSLEASSSFGSSSLSLPSPFKSIEGSDVSCVPTSGSEVIYTLEGALSSLRYDTTYTIKLLGYNKITNVTYLTSSLKTASFDESKDVGLYWECHCLKDGYCSYQVEYPVTKTDWTSFRFDLVGKKKQKSFSFTMSDNLHDIHTFYALDKDSGSYTASVYAIGNDKTETLVKTADVAI